MATFSLPPIAPHDPAARSVPLPSVRGSFETLRLHQPFNAQHRLSPPQPVNHRLRAIRTARARIWTCHRTDHRVRARVSRSPEKGPRHWMVSASESSISSTGIGSVDQQIDRRRIGLRSAPLRFSAPGLLCLQMTSSRQPFYEGLRSEVQKDAYLTRFLYGGAI